MLPAIIEHKRVVAVWKAGRGEQFHMLFAGHSVVYSESILKPILLTLTVDRR
jgi:hypothetical protein